MTTHYRRGADWERAVKKELEEKGYLVVRSAGSRGPVDIVAVGPREVLLIQCKIRKPTAAERRKAAEAARKYGRIIMIRWPDEGREWFGS